MGAHERALVALDAVFLDPVRDVDGHAALFVLRGGGGEGAVFGEGGNRLFVALLGQYGPDDLVEILGLVGRGLGGVGGAGPGGRHLDLDQPVHGHVHGVDVHLDDFFALLAVGLLDGVLKQADGLLDGQHAGQLEKGGLHHHVDARAEAGLGADGHGVDVVDLELLVRDGAQHVPGQVGFEVLGGVPGGVEHEGAAFLHAFEDIVDVHVARLVAGDVVGRIHEVRGLDGLFAEAQVRDGDAAGLLGVVGEVTLGVEVGVVADDLDRRLVRADGAVGAEAPELALHGAFGNRGQRAAHGQGGAGHVVVDADDEVALGRGRGHVVVDRLGHAGAEFLGPEAVAAAHELGNRAAAFDERRAHVLVERIAEAAGLLGAVEHGDHLGRGGHDLEKRIRGERTEQAHLDQANLLALGVQVVDHFLDGFARGAHGHDDAVGVGRAHVVEELVGTAGQRADLVHHGRDDAGQYLIIGIGALAALEEDVRVLSGAAQVGVLGIHGLGAEGGDLLVIDQALDVLVVDDLDLLDLVRGAEAVEEVDEGHAAFDGREVGDER